ncbi:LPS export ABC transporter periplasmic protein LptC [Candidatus Thioglobus sp.]|uniref:LPS export ABC transporter periplasmic protein LptC n=1 Tax=Candidatus Thioglobus sp. TaxID=2026721 RepID=UPI0025C1F711|nr:LPS export ABC transporter periplasmic protein LptC [Candidatus Thioglobus sp.]
MNFQLKHNLLISVFIIVIIFAMWLLMKALSYSFDALQENTDPVLTQNEEVSKEVSYMEKIDNFALQEFNADNRLSHFVKATNYFHFKNSPALLLNPEVTTYDEQGKKDYVLTSERADYLDSGEISFKGKVNVHSSSGITHKMKTKELLVGTKTDDLVSNKKVTYLGENAKIVSQGMHMQTRDDKMKLTGKTVIKQDSGQKILTKNLNIDQSNGQKHYYSKHNTTYLAKEDTIYSTGMDLDMQEKILQLSGKVKILQNSGTKINTQDLVVDQSNDGDVYRTEEKIHYQSKLANINAVGMHYDAKNKKVKLTGGVAGVYE